MAALITMKHGRITTPTIFKGVRAVFYKVYTNLTNIITWAVILCVIAAAMLFAAPKLLGITPYIVMSGSMEPAIHTGSVAYIGESDEAPDKGDIIGFIAGDGKAVVHRVHDKTIDGYVTKGDANNAPDMALTQQQNIIGPYLGSIPAAGYVLAYVSGAKVAIGPLQIPAAVLAAAGLVLILNVIQCILKSPDEE